MLVDKYDKFNNIVEDLKMNFGVVKLKTHKENVNHIFIYLTDIKENVRLKNFEVKLHLNLNNFLQENFEWWYHPDPNRLKFLTRHSSIDSFSNDVKDIILYLQLDESYINEVDICKDPNSEKEDLEWNERYQRSLKMAKHLKEMANLFSAPSVPTSSSSAGAGGGGRIVKEEEPEPKPPQEAVIGQMRIGLDFIIS
jgi:hypothetical protein